MLIKTIGYELSKIRARKKYSIVLIIEMIIVIFMGFFAKITFDVSGNPLKIDLPNLYFTVLTTFLTFILPITIFMLVSDVVTQEFENNNIKNILLRPVSRFNIYLAKNISICIYIFVNLMLLYFVTLIARILGQGSFNYIFEGFFSYVVSIVPLFTFVTFGTMIACRVSSSSMTMFLLLILQLVLSGLSIYSPRIGSVFFVNYLGYYKFFIGNILSIKHIITVTLFLLSGSFIFFILGFLSFDNKNIN